VVPTKNHAEDYNDARNNYRNISSLKISIKTNLYYLNTTGSRGPTFWVHPERGVNFRPPVFQFPDIPFPLFSYPTNHEPGSQFEAGEADDNDVVDLAAAARRSVMQLRRGAGFMLQGGLLFVESVIYRRLRPGLVFPWRNSRVTK
jgi:hypothetical protein